MAQTHSSTQTASTQTASRQTAETDPHGPGSAPVLKWVVIILGVLLVVGFAVVITTIISRAVKISGEGRSAAGRSGRGFAPVDLALPKGAAVERMALNGDRMALHVSGEGISQIIIVDVKRGEVLGRVRLNGE